MDSPMLTAIGWRPEPDTLNTPAGCDAALSELGSRKKVLQERMQARVAGDRAPYAAEIARLAALRRDISERRVRLLDEGDPERYFKTFKSVVRERVSAEAYREIIAEVDARIARYEAQPSTAAHGPVLEPRSTGGSMRRRA